MLLSVIGFPKTCYVVLKILFLLILTTGAYSQSCAGNCGSSGSGVCQCDLGCEKYGDCCTNYENICLSCQNRCEEPYRKAKPCQCNSKCQRYRNCCPDYGNFCKGSGGARQPGGRRGSGGGNSVTASQLRILSENLLNLDSGGTTIPINAQGKASSSNTRDMAAEPLIGNVPSSVLNWETTRLMQLLLDNYEPQASVREVTSSQEQSEEDNFLNALVNTAVMKEVERFLKEKRLLSGTIRSKLKEIWFTPYKRAGRNIGSSGFEHVFVGELKGGKVSGFHNWLNFRKEEQDGDLDYKGYMKRVSLNGKGEIIKLRFVWLNEEKPVGSIFVGTTPELEMALYTVCFTVMPDANCPVQLAGHKFSIQTWTYSSRGKPVIGSAYPNI